MLSFMFYYKTIILSPAYNKKKRKEKKNSKSLHPGPEKLAILPQLYKC